MAPDGLGSFAGDYGGEGFYGGLLYVAEAAEVGEEALACFERLRAGGERGCWIYRVSHIPEDVFC